MFKYIETKDNLGIPRTKHEKIMNLEPGTIFGEDALINGKANQYTIKSVNPVICLTISYNDFKKEFKRIIP